MSLPDFPIASAQFEHRSGDKAYNLERIHALSLQARQAGAKAVAFHELCISGYTFLRHLDRKALEALSEPLDDSPSISRLQAISRETGLYVLAGVLERDQDRIYNTYVCVGPFGLIARHRKLHPFISPYLSPGDSYTVFDLDGWRCGILICYDNNIIENVRATTLLGADILFAPHVTMCTPSPMPGRGFVDPQLWESRHRDPVPLRLEFDGPKGMRWLMRWLPARAYDNGIYIVFSNPVGMDDDQLKNGNPLLLDPFGEVMAELKSFEDGICVAVCSAEKLPLSGGRRYLKARRPELYGEILSRSHDSRTEPVWLKPS